MPVPGGHDSDTAVSLALLAVANAAIAAAKDVPADSIDVVGTGLIARQVRALLEESVSERRTERPRAIIDTTGAPSAIVDATRRVAALGTVVLVGEDLGRETDMNVYPDVHARGLSLIGIGPPLQNDAPFAETGFNDDLIASCRKALVAVSPGAPLRPGAAWYRVSS